MRNNKNLIREWSLLPEIFNTFPYGVLPKPVNTLATLFTMDIQILNGFPL
jgi:hypothetical protein